MRNQLQNIKNEYKEVAHKIAIQNSFGRVEIERDREIEYNAVEKFDFFFDDIREQMIALVLLTDLDVDEDEIRDKIYNLNNNEIEENLTKSQIVGLIEDYKNLIEELQNPEQY